MRSVQQPHGRAVSSSSEDASLSPLQRASREGKLGTWSEEVWRKIDAYLPKLRAFVRRKSFDSRMNSENEDVTQQLVLDAIQASRKGVDEPTYVPAYLQTMASNEIRDRVRKERVRPMGHRILFKKAVNEDDFFKGMECRKENPIAALQVQEIERIVKKMSRPYREVFEVHFLEGHDLAETARILGTSVQAIKSRNYRLREKLNEYAQANGFEHCKLREAGTERGPWTEQEAERRTDSTPRQPGV